MYLGVEEPFEFESFENLTKKQANEYLNWYISIMDSREKYLEEYIEKDSGEPISLDHSPDSLIPLWTWFETQIEIEDKTPEEIEEDVKGRPEWIIPTIRANTTKFSLNTQVIELDLGIYFGNVVAKNNPSIYWGNITTSKTFIDFNKPILLGFRAGNDMNPNRIISVLTRKSSRERDPLRLYNSYHIWLKYI